MPTQRVETPEGVTLELELAGAGSRFAAALIDALIFGSGLFLLLWLLVLIGQIDSLGGSQFVLAFVSSGFLLVMAVLLAWTHHLRHGTTPGKSIFGLRVVGMHAERPSFVAYLLRSFFGPSSSCPCRFRWACSS